MKLWIDKRIVVCVCVCVCVCVFVCICMCACVHVFSSLFPPHCHSKTTGPGISTARGVTAHSTTVHKHTQYLLYILSHEIYSADCTYPHTSVQIEIVD